MELLGALKPGDLLMSAAGGFLLSFGLVALAPVLPARVLPAPGVPASGAGRWRLALSAALGLALLALGVVLAAFVFWVGPWAPLLIAAGLGLLAAPPLCQLVVHGVRRAVGPAIIALGAAGAAAAALAMRL